jgi:hypothetical protein
MSNYIGNQPSAGEFKKLDSIASSFNGSLTQFDLDYSTVNQSVGDATQLIVSLNGIIQEPGAAYTLGIGGGSIVFASAPASTDTCHIVLLGGVGGTTTPTDGSVTASKLDSSLKDYLEETFTANGSQTTYTLTRAAIGSNSLLLSVDGIVQPSTAYSVAGTTLTISPALPNTTNVRVVHLGVQSGVYIPAADSITSNQLATLNGNLNFDDNAKAVFGEGSDLQIYHDGGNSYVKETGTGALVLQSAGPAIVLEKTDGENMILANIDGDVKLYYNGSEKLATTSIGIDVTGTVTSDGLTSTGSGANTTYFIGGDNSVAGRQLTLSSEATVGQNNATHRLTVPSGYGSFNVSVNSSERLKINNNGDISFYEDTGTSAKFFWDASTERLGLGTSSPSRQLEIYDDGTVGQAVLALTAQNTDYSRIMFADPDDSNIGILDYAHSDNSMRFTVNNEVRMRIDSSGNLLVGKTSAGYNVDGFEARQNGETYVSRSGTPMAINRNSSNGTALNFYKDGAGVGDIGSDNGRLYIQSSGGANLAGIGFSRTAVAVEPRKNNAFSSAEVDIGSATYKFRDVYLSGGIQFDSRSNKLDDYEEGTWTPSILVENAAAASITVNHASYTKIGRLVSLVFDVTINSVTGTNSSRAIQLEGMPFTINTASGGGPNIAYTNLTNSMTGSLALQGRFNTRYRIVNLNGATGQNASDHIQASTVLRGQFTYHTDQ